MPLVIAALIGLLLLGAALVIPRLGDDDPPQQGTRGNSGGGAPVYEMKPEVIGAPYEEVEAVLEDQGYAVEVQRVDSGEPADTILETNPTPGTPLQSGQTITLVVAGG
ncbi:MAG: PASTA domain-containing protein [Actinobacteria bacterium]|nr:PASTA domain-containing protein [Actinomycetota bacterium]